MELAANPEAAPDQTGVADRAIVASSICLSTSALLEPVVRTAEITTPSASAAAITIIRGLSAPIHQVDDLHARLFGKHLKRRLGIPRRDGEGATRRFRAEKAR